MGYKVRIQKIQRAANKTYYVNFPCAFADAINLEKGEEMEWFIEGRNCFVLKRVKEAGSFLQGGGAGEGADPTTDAKESIGGRE